jgi:hypothetical protein
MNAVQLSVRSCIDAVRAIDYRQTPHTPRDAVGGGGNPRPFAFTKTGSTGGTVLHGSVYISGASKTLSSWTNHGSGDDLTLSSVTTTTRYYIACEFGSSTTASWNSTTGAFPASDSDTEVFPILTLTCADSVITGIKEHFTSDIHVDNKRVKNVVIDVQYDTTTHRIEQKLVAATVVDLAADGAFATITGGQAVVEAT